MILVGIVLRCVDLGHAVQSLKVDELVCRQVKGSYSLTAEIAVSFSVCQGGLLHIVIFQTFTGWVTLTFDKQYKQETFYQI